MVAGLRNQHRNYHLHKPKINPCLTGHHGSSTLIRSEQFSANHEQEGQNRTCNDSGKEQ